MKQQEILFVMIIWITVHKINKKSDRIEIIDFLKRQAPNLWFSNGIKQKLVSCMYRFTPHWYIHLRYLYEIICKKTLINILPVKGAVSK